jgi:hypothetical protein
MKPRNPRPLPPSARPTPSLEDLEKKVAAKDPLYWEVHMTSCTFCGAEPGKRCRRMSVENPPGEELVHHHPSRVWAYRKTLPNPLKRYD